MQNDGRSGTSNTSNTSNTGDANADGGDSIYSIILQIVGGVVIAIIIYWISLYAMQRDQLVSVKQKNLTNRPMKFPVIQGYIDCVSMTNRSFNTSNQLSKSYVPMPRSVNRKGGAQFSYSFWIYLDNVDDSNIANKVLFCKGNMTPFPYIMVDKDTYAIVDRGQTNIVQCPMVRFGKNYKELIVNFNTMDNFNEAMVIESNVAENDTAMRRNLLSLLPHYWVLMTFVFEDNMPINDFENGTIIRFYMNDTLYQVYKTKSSLKQNNGDINILPDSSNVGIKSARMSDFNYYNYAVNDDEVRSAFAKGPNRSTSKIVNGNADVFGTPLYLSTSNRLDQTNA